MFGTGDTVTITGPVVTGNVGTVVHHDADRGLHLVRIGAVTQDYFPASDLALFSA